MVHLGPKTEVKNTMQTKNLFKITCNTVENPLEMDSGLIPNSMGLIQPFPHLDGLSFEVLI